MSSVQSPLPTLRTSDIKFKTGPEVQFFHTLRQRVDAYFQEHNLSRNANGKMIAKTIILLSAYVLPFATLLLFPMAFFPAMFLWILMGWAKAGIGMNIMHDANHGAYSSNARINTWIGWTLNILGGSVANWKVQHNMLHHTYTNITGLDQDIDTGTLMRLSPHEAHRRLHGGQWWYAFLLYGIMTMYWTFVKDFFMFWSYYKRGLHKEINAAPVVPYLRVIGVKVMYFAVFLGLPVLAGIPLLHVLGGFILMHVTCGIILSVVFQLAHSIEGTEHPMPDAAGNLEDSWALHQLRTTMNFARHNKWLSWYIGGLNFQVEHHLFTRICHVHYPAIAPIVKRTAEEYGFPYLEYRTFSQAFKSHIQLLRKFGRPPLDEIMG
jgi:linoleoyl-CoA desaturase